MYLYHFGAFNAQNAGDALLGKATEDLFDRNAYWGRYHIYAGEPPDKIIEHINDKVDAVVIGAGGFIIPTYTKSAEVSGWHSPLSLEQIKQIKKPIIGFGLGYNKFRRQEGFNELFVPNINQLVEQSVFFGLRNYGSIEKLTPFLKTGLVHKLKYQPDPATLLSYLYPQYENVLPRYNEIAFEVALDGSSSRFGKTEEGVVKILRGIRRAMVELSRNHDVKVVLHGVCDIQSGLLEVLFGHLSTERYKIIELFHRPIKDILDFYAGCPLTIAMRGHGQLIPFGLGNPFVSLISHPKLKFFLDDVGLDSSVDIKEPHLSDRIVETVESLDDNAFREKIKTERKRLWEITQENIKTIRTVIRR